MKRSVLVWMCAWGLCVPVNARAQEVTVPYCILDEGDASGSCAGRLPESGGSGSDEIVKEELPDISVLIELPAIPLGPANVDKAANGAAVSPAGDLNGDGIADLVSGAPGSRVGAAPRGRVEAGAALVYLGTADEQELTEPDIVFKGEAAHDRAGVSVAGNFDFDGDGIPDILIGAEQFNRTADDDPVAGCDAGSPCGAGVAYLILFKPSEYPNLGDPTTTDFIDLSEVGSPAGSISGVKLTGSLLGDRAGAAVAGGGRINAGIGQDILIGAPGADPGAPARTDAGAAYLVFDDPGLDGKTVSLSQVANDLIPPADKIEGVVYEGHQPGDALGFAVAFPGDVVGGDDVDDVALGAPLADPETAQTTALQGGGPLRDAGTVYVPLGGGVASAIIEACKIGNGSGGGVAGAQVVGDQPGMQLGFALSTAGDSIVNGATDLLIGAPLFDFEDEGGGTIFEAGAVAQTAGGLPLNSIIEACKIGNGSGGGVEGVLYTGEATGDQLGAAVAGVGDVTGDGLDDVALGAPFSNPIPLSGGPAVIDAGTVYVVDGSPPDGSAAGQVRAFDIGGPVAGAQLIGVDPNEHAGRALGPGGDISDDGQRDMLVGAPQKVIDAIESGTVYVVLDTSPPVVDGCGSDGCTVSELSTGAMLLIEPGSLGVTIAASAKGLLEPLELPPLPAGTTLLGAARFEEKGSVLGLAATATIPLRPEVERQFAGGESLELMVHDGNGWQGSGVFGTVVPSPLRPGRLAVQAQITVLDLYALMVADDDRDGYGDAPDCAPTNAALWGAPDEVRVVRLDHDRVSGTTTLFWTGPALPGTKTTVRYDTIRTDDPTDLVSAAVCVESNGLDMEATDAMTPAPGQVLHFVIRAENDCGPDQGSLGAGPDGMPKTALACS